MPPAATDGEYSVTGMSPRSASICGGGSVTLPGVYPASGAVYVWFGDAGPVVLAGGSTQALSVTVPAMVTPGVINVSVRFQRDRTYTMTLASAFAYTAANCNAASTMAPITTVAAGAGAGAGAVQATTTTAPAVTVPATTPTTEAKSGTTTPAVTTPAVTTPATPTTTPGGETTPTTTAPANSSAVVNTRGSLRIRMVAAGGVLSGLNGLWPGTGCKQTACPAIGF